MIIAIIIHLALPPALPAQTAKAENEVYGPVVSGFFYPRSEDKLKEMISNLLEKAAEQELRGKPVALISPHAGYDYSGGVAAHGFKAIMGRNYTRVIILAPSHYGGRYRGVAVLKASRYKTPLGEVEIDKEVCDKLVNNSPPLGPYRLIDYSSRPYRNEHAIETQLPFLQMVLGKFKLVPLLINLLMEDDFDKVADAVKPYIDDSTLIIASSDFTHYGRRFDYVPFFTRVEEQIKALDYGAIERILDKDFEGFYQYKKDTGITVCGFMPIAVLLKLLPADAQGKVLKYDTSGRMVEDFSHSVSYASIVFTVPTGKKTGEALRLPTSDLQIVLVADPPKEDTRATALTSGPAPLNSRTLRAALIYTHKAHSYLALEQYKEALEAAQRAIELVPALPNAHMYKGHALYALGRTKEASEAWSLGLSHLAELGEASLPVIDEALKEKEVSDNPEIWLFKGFVLIKTKQFDEAIEACNRALEIDPMYARAYNNRGLAYAEGKQDYDRAIADYDRAIEINPNLAEAYYNKALVCEKAGRTGEAVAAYKGFIQYAPPQYATYIQHARQRIRELEGRQAVAPSRASPQIPSYLSLPVDRGVLPVCL